MIKLFHGDSTFLSLREVNRQVESIQSALGKKNTSPEKITVDCTLASFTDLSGRIETPSFLSEHRIFVLKRPTQSKDKDHLQNYLITQVSNKSKDSTCDILVWEDKKLRSNSKLVTTFRKAALIYESPELKSFTFVKWAAEEVEGQSLQISRGALNLLSERTNYDPERFTQEVQKLMLLKSGLVEEEDVEKTCPDTLEHSIWTLIDSINTGNRELSARELSVLMRQGHDPTYILLMIARNLRLVILVKLLAQKGLRSYDIARKIKVSPYAIDKMTFASRNANLDRTRAIYDKISNIDYSSKTGQIDTELALSILLSVI